MHGYWTLGEADAWDEWFIVGTPYYQPTPGSLWFQLPSLEGEGPLISGELGQFISRSHSQSVYGRALYGTTQLFRAGGSEFLIEVCPEDLNFWEVTPILLDLDQNQFHLSGGPVHFDIDADGEEELITWVSPNELDAFLYLDRNGNGLVDNGAELFGNFTILSGGENAQNGYEALAEFDLPQLGGNEDDMLDELDVVFSELRVWIDSNSDGQFDLDESLGINDAGIVAIALDYASSRRQDQFGNQFRYISNAWIHRNGSIKRIRTTDVYFQFVSPN